MTFNKRREQASHCLTCLLSGNRGQGQAGRERMDTADGWAAGLYPAVPFSSTNRSTNPVWDWAVKNPRMGSSLGSTGWSRPAQLVPSGPARLNWHWSCSRSESPSRWGGEAAVFARGPKTTRHSDLRLREESGELQLPDWQNNHLGVNSWLKKRKRKKNLSHVFGKLSVLY